MHSQPPYWLNLKRVHDPKNPNPTNPVSLADMKKHLRETAMDFDSEIYALTRAAADRIEGPEGAGVSLTSQDYELFLDMFPWEIIVPIGPMIGVVSITYTDTDGDPQTVDPAVYETDLVRGRIRPVEGQSWPSTKYIYNAVTVRFTSGYEAVPADLVQAVKLIVGHWYEHRSEATAPELKEIPMGAYSIIENYRRGRFV